MVSKYKAAPAKKSARAGKAPAPRPWAPEARVLADAIRARRKNLGLTQIELGRFAGCGPAFLYELESGKPTLRLDKLLDVLAVLGLSLVLSRGKSGLSVSSDLAQEIAR